MADTLTASGAIDSTSFGKTAEPMPTVDSSAPSEMPPKVVKPPTRQRKRRETKVDPQTLLEIAQSTLARLSESGVVVRAKQDGNNIVVTIVWANLDAETKKFTLLPPEPLEL